MSKFQKLKVGGLDPLGVLAREQPPLSFTNLGQAVLRGRWTIISALAICWMIGGAVIAVTPTSYMASTQVMLEPLPRKPISVAVDGVADPLDSAQADSRMQIVRSERLLRFVAETIGWKREQKSGDASDASALTNVVTWLRAQVSPAPRTDVRTRAVLDLMDRVSVRRLGLSYVIEISFTAGQPELAAAMANTVTAAYFHTLVMASQLEDEVLQRRLANVQAEEQALVAAMKQGVMPDQYFPDANARVISAALVPISKAAPKSILIMAMATAIALAISSMLIMSRFQRDRTVRTGRESFIPPALRLLATFPNMQSRPVLAPVGKAEPTLEMAGAASHLLLAEAIEPLDTERHKIVGFVAAEGCAGTSSVALSMSRQAAKSGTRVVVVDANISKPYFSRFATSPTNEGWMDWLGSPSGTTVPNFLKCPDFELALAGASEAEISRLASPRLGDLLRDLSKRGPVFVDCPALDDSFVALTMARHIDTFILVASSGKTTAADLVDCAERLSGKVEGFVLNRLGKNRDTPPCARVDRRRTSNKEAEAASVFDKPSLQA